MNELKSSLAILVILWSFVAFGQNESDALRYSFNQARGTARTQALGGAFGALGGDYGAISINPAATGVFRKSDFSFSPTFTVHGTESDYLSNRELAAKLNFNIGSLGWVKNYTARQGSAWESYGFSIGMNRLDEFHNRWTASGTNQNSSIIDAFLLDIRENDVSWQELDGQQYAPFSTGLAWNTFLVDTVDFTGAEFFGANSINGVSQNIEYEERGSLYDYHFSFAGNIDNKLFLGAKATLLSMQYEYSTVYKESPSPNDTLTTLTQLTYGQELEVSGTGFNLSVGAIYTPVDILRIGASVQTPTSIRINDSYTSTITANYAGFGEVKSSTPADNEQVVPIEYRVVTPFRATGSLAFIIGKYGLISADYEYVDYGMARMRNTFTSDFDFTRSNANAEAFFNRAGNLRIGGEYRINTFWSARGGYSLWTNPLNSAVGTDLSTTRYTAGFGYRNANFYCDFVYALQIQKDEYLPYDSRLTPAVQLTTNSHTIGATIGWRY